MNMNSRPAHINSELPVWLAGSFLTTCLLAFVAILALLLVRGMTVFWPASVVEFHYYDSDFQEEVLTSGILWEQNWLDRLDAPEAAGAAEFANAPEAAAEFANAAAAAPEAAEFAKANEQEQWTLKIGNRDLNGADFAAYWVQDIRSELSYPENLGVFERAEWGVAIGRLTELKNAHGTISADDELLWRTLADSLGSNNAQDQGKGPQPQPFLATIVTADGGSLEINSKDLLRAWRPNAMSIGAKIWNWCVNFWKFLAEDPREANTEGGIFPAIIGTIALVFLMTIIVTPLGVIAAIYLSEYAGKGPIVALLRISISNLAGVPSVVFGVFGLGFFVYGLGANIDELFFADTLPTPTFGTPGLLWAALTLAVLTLPVVIVATEEGLRRVPQLLREGSRALGATKLEMLVTVVLPMTVPAMLTGVILAVARAAGEVAPIMLVGAVKYSPELPLSATFPFIHLDQKFMHMGFHIFDLAFQSPNIENSLPLVYATSLILILAVIILNFTAMLVRNRIREKYRALDSL